jgi:homospermidine synthase
MIHVFCKEKGSGKSKALVNLANSKVEIAKGNLVYIDDDKRALLEVDRNIRFICSEDFNIHNYKDFYGFMCGIISKDYDIEAIFIDGLLNDICKSNEDMVLLLSKLEFLAGRFNINFYININCNEKEIPIEIKKYVA